MTSPPRQVDVHCPECATVYRDWIRPSINLTLEDFDDEYMDKATSAICPNCGRKVQLDCLVVGRDGTFRVGPTNAGEDTEG